MKSNTLSKTTKEKSLNSFKFSVMKINKDDRVKVSLKDHSILIGYVKIIHDNNGFKLIDEKFDEHELKISDVETIGKDTY